MVVLGAVYTRLNQAMPAAAVLPPHVQTMSRHGAKRLSARIEFIPGLEEHILQGRDSSHIPAWCLKQHSRFNFPSSCGLRAQLSDQKTYVRKKVVAVCGAVATIINFVYETCS
jgi:hypothetical protein